MGVFVTAGHGLPFTTEGGSLFYFSKASTAGQKFFRASLLADPSENSGREALVMETTTYGRGPDARSNHPSRDVAFFHCVFLDFGKVGVGLRGMWYAGGGLSGVHLPISAIQP